MTLALTNQYAHLLSVEVGFPPMESMQRFLSISAQMNATQLALAVERYRLTHADGVPETLGALVPGFLHAAPIDPFDGGPFRFKKLSRGYVVYSVGPDGKDDGGLEQRSGASKTNYDVTFTVDR